MVHGRQAVMLLNPKGTNLVGRYRRCDIGCERSLSDHSVCSNTVWWRIESRTNTKAFIKSSFKKNNSQDKRLIFSTFTFSLKPSCIYLNDIPVLYSSCGWVISKCHSSLWESKRNRITYPQGHGLKIPFLRVMATQNRDSLVAFDKIRSFL